jgi:ADP-ribose pyrophosphatase
MDKSTERVTWGTMRLSTECQGFIFKSLCFLIDKTSFRNPVGRTGLIGKGCLGRWGPNHAADPIVTRFDSMHIGKRSSISEVSCSRWKRDGRGNMMKHGSSGRPILQFVAIQRRDSGEWAIPGVGVFNSSL